MLFMVQQIIVDPIAKFTETFYGQVAVGVAVGLLLGLIGAIVSRICKRKRKKND